EPCQQGGARPRLRVPVHRSLPAVADPVTFRGGAGRSKRKSIGDLRRALGGLEKSRKWGVRFRRGTPYRHRLERNERQTRYKEILIIRSLVRLLGLGGEAGPSRAASTRRFTPRLEVLDGRAMPSVAVVG